MQLQFPEAECSECRLKLCSNRSAIVDADLLLQLQVCEAVYNSELAKSSYNMLYSLIKLSIIFEWKRIVRPKEFIWDDRRHAALKVVSFIDSPLPEDKAHILPLHKPTKYKKYRPTYVCVCAMV